MTAIRRGGLCYSPVLGAVALACSELVACGACFSPVGEVSWSDGGSPDAAPADAGGDSGVPDAGGLDAGGDGGLTPDAGLGLDAGPCSCCVPGAAGFEPGCVPGPAPDLSHQASYGSGSSYWGVATGDLNGDGLLDLVTVKFPSTGPEVFFGQPDGTLASPVEYQSGADGNAITVADLNGDHFPDVLITGSPGVLVFMNRGDGSLSAPVAYTTNGFNQSIGVADVNGDGYPDMVLNTQLFLGNGDGTFGSPIPIPTQEDQSGGLVAADFNGDGLADIAVSGPHLSLTVLLTQPDGGFEETSYPGVGAGGVTLLHANCNAPPDLAIASQGTAISVFRNRGDGHFDLSGTYPLPHLVGLSLIEGDFNGDCVADLMVSGWAKCGDGLVVALYGNGRGGFDPAVTLSTSSTGPKALARLGPVTAPRGLGIADECGNGILTLGVPPKQP